MTTSGAITKRIDRMEADNLVTRIPVSGDRRTVRIRLTAHGREVTDNVFGMHIDNEARLLDALDRAQSDQLADTLRTLLAALGDTAIS